MSDLLDKAREKHARATPGRMRAEAKAILERLEAQDAAKNGRRQKDRAKRFDAERQVAFIALLAYGMTVTRACRIVGTTAQTARGLYARDTEFRAAWDLAMDTGTDMIDDKIMEIGLEGRDERIRLEALKFLARARKPEVYSENQKLSVTTQSAGPTRERLAELREAAQESAEDDEVTRAIEIVAEQFAGRVTKEAVLQAEPLPPEVDDE